MPRADPVAAALPRDLDVEKRAGLAGGEVEARGVWVDIRLLARDEIPPA